MGIINERSVAVDHATLIRRVDRCAGRVSEDARPRKQPADRSWRMDETYIKAKGPWLCLYGAIAELGKTLAFTR